MTITNHYIIRYPIPRGKNFLPSLLKTKKERKKKKTIFKCQCYFFDPVTSISLKRTLSPLQFSLSMNFGVSTSMDVAAISIPSLHFSIKSSAAISLQAPRSRNACSVSLFSGFRRFGLRIISVKAEQASSRVTDDDFIIEDVPHLTDFLPHLPVLLKCFLHSLRYYFSGLYGQSE